MTGVMVHVRLKEATNKAIDKKRYGRRQQKGDESVQWKKYHGCSEIGDIMLFHLS
jgi:hypothetical protein